MNTIRNKKKRNGYCCKGPAILDRCVKCRAKIRSVKAAQKKRAYDERRRLGLCVVCSDPTDGRVRCDRHAKLAVRDTLNYMNRVKAQK